MKRIPVFFGALLAGLLFALLAGLLVTQPRTLFSFFNRVRSPATSRAAELLYLSPTSQGSEIWRSKVGTEQKQSLTFTGGRLLNFQPSPDGESVAFSMLNSQQGSDVMLVGRDGQDQRVLVRCGADACDHPVWSMDGKLIAFTRLSAQPVPGETPGLDRPWIFDVVTNQAYPLESDPLITAEELSWSPDGSRIAFYDPQSKGIRVRILSSGQEMVLASNVPQAGSWSPDGKQFLFAVEENQGGFAVMKIYRMDFTTRKADLLLGKQAGDAGDYNLPRYSPDGQWLVFGLRTLAGSPSKQLRLMRADGTGLRVVTDNPAYTQAAYRWSPDGKVLVFQRFQLGASTNVPEVMAWNVDSGALNLVARDASSPEWLP